MRKSSFSDDQVFSMNKNILKIRGGMDLENHLKFNEHFKNNDSNNNSPLIEDNQEFPNFQKTNSILDPNITKIQKKKEDIINESPLKKLQSTMIIPLIRKTINKMKNSTVFRNINILKDYHFSILNDNAYVSDFVQSQNYFIKLQILNPFHPFIIFFKLCDCCSYRF